MRRKRRETGGNGEIPAQKVRRRRDRTGTPMVILSRPFVIPSEAKGEYKKEILRRMRSAG